MANIAASASLNPFPRCRCRPCRPNRRSTTSTKRGGFDQIGTASPANGGGPVYVFESDGAFAPSSTSTATARWSPKPAQWDDTFPDSAQSRVGASITSRRGYDWIKDTGGNPPEKLLLLLPKN